MELRLFKIVKTGELCKKCEIGTRLLLEPYFQGFCGIDVFIWERLNSSIYAEMV